MEDLLREILEGREGRGQVEVEVDENLGPVEEEDMKNLPQNVLTTVRGDVIKASSMIVVFATNMEYNGEAKPEKAMGAMVIGPWSMAATLAAKSMLEQKFRQVVEGFTRD